jgi:hypothetical protein
VKQGLVFTTEAGTPIIASNLGQRAFAPLLNDACVHGRQADTIERVSVSTTGEEGNATSVNSSISADGQRVALGS